MFPSELQPIQDRNAKYYTVLPWFRDWNVGSYIYVGVIITERICKMIVTKVSKIVSHSYNKELQKKKKASFLSHLIKQQGDDFKYRWLLLAICALLKYDGDTFQWYDRPLSWNVILIFVKVVYDKAQQ